MWSPLRSRSRTIESSSPPHLPPARPSTASGPLAATSTTREPWPPLPPSSGCARSSGCRPARPRRSISFNSCSATDTSVRSCQRPWSGCRSRATSSAAPTRTCSTRQTGPTCSRSPSATAWTSSTTYWASSPTCRPSRISVKETGEQIVKTAADQIAVIGTLTSGATASVHVREAVAGGTGFLWEINGTDGTLRITAEAALPEIYPLTVAGARGRNEPAELAVPEALTQKWPALSSLEGAPAYNVGRAYAAFAADIDDGSHTVPDFADGVRRREVISAIERAAASGERVKV